MTRSKPRLKWSESQSFDRDHKNIKTKTKNVETKKDETSKFGSRLICEKLSRPRLIKTEKLYRYRDLDSSRLKTFIDVETESHRDWEVSWMLRPRLIETDKYQNDTKGLKMVQNGPPICLKNMITTCLETHLCCVQNYAHTMFEDIFKHCSGGLKYFIIVFIIYYSKDAIHNTILL